MASVNVVTAAHANQLAASKNSTILNRETLIQKLCKFKYKYFFLKHVKIRFTSAITDALISERLYSMTMNVITAAQGLSESYKRMWDPCFVKLKVIMKKKK